MSIDCNAPPAPRLRRPGGAPPIAWYGVVRTVVDFVAALILLVAAAPFVLLAALAVRLTSRGPAVFTQVRLGKGGRPFHIYKLRSMYTDAERLSGPCWSNGRDPRVTPVGRFIRRTHIDELPQLWNVLSGDMSLIGPRPERPELIPELERAMPRYRERLRVLPGVTGLAQVQLPPDVNVASVRRKLAYDLYYIEAVGPWLDLRILLSTALKVVGVPFPVLQALFRMPTRREVEGSYRTTGRPVARVQPA